MPLGRRMTVRTLVLQRVVFRRPHLPVGWVNFYRAHGTRSDKGLPSTTTSESESMYDPVLDDREAYVAISRNLAAGIDRVPHKRPIKQARKQSALIQRNCSD